ncbi:MAG: hypothetical protein JWQ96_650 [Segetibacter sp.]|nr:hypothetical protein [Segetibacter sp.]
MRKGAILIWLVILSSAVAALFWYNEWVYALPTPVPATYKGVSRGQKIHLKQKVSESNKPVFLHFFNPDCPCSRFNINHFKSLVKQYGNEVAFGIVVMSADKGYTAKAIQDKFDLNIPVYFDSAIAKECGVYSTPQAVILSPDNTLYYRGNYNKSRYCTEKKSNYAQIALDSLLNKSLHPIYNQAALKAYGCELPTCNK